MTLQKFLQHRALYEFIAIIAILSLVVVVNATTIGIEYMRSGTGPDWQEGWATEITSVLVLGLLILPLIKSLDWLDLRLANLKWRVLWLVPLILTFSLVHVGGFILLRKLLWPLAGGEYSFEPWLLGLVYELRKDFLSFLVLITSYYAYRFIIDRLQGEARFLDSEDTQDNAEQRSQFLVKMLDREYLVKVEDIDWVQSASNYVVFHCGERTYPMRMTMKRISRELGRDGKGARFQRVHRTAIVNLRKVKSLQDRGEITVALNSGVTIPVSRTYLSGLRSSLQAVNPGLVD